MLSNARLHDLLEKTSRTFALCIPLLPEPNRTHVGLAYLLFRVADTYEDAALWTKAQRSHALEAFELWLQGRLSPAAKEALLELGKKTPPSNDPGYLELLDSLPAVMASFAALPPKAREIIERYTLETTVGMRGIVEQAEDDGSFQLPDLPALRSYCYIVAGLVGEMLTELFCLHESRLADAHLELLPLARWFGEALQLVNILKDAPVDASEGRSFLPSNVPKEIIFSYAHDDIKQAIRYILTLEKAGASVGILRFASLPLLLALDALALLDRRGPATKIPKARVFEAIERLHDTTEKGLPLAPLFEGWGFF